MSLRRAKEVEYVTAIAAVEKHSIFARPEHADSLGAYLTSKGIRLTREPNVVNGEDNLLVEKETGFDDLMGHINAWKK